MKILFIDTYYPTFLRSFWRSHSDLRQGSYQSQRGELLDQCFGTSDYYSCNINRLGHKAFDHVVNDAISQRQWAQEHELRVSAAGVYARLQSLPLLHRAIGRPRWVQQIALAQINDFAPDVLYVQDLSILNPDTIRQAKQLCKLVVGQTASPLPALRNVKSFDLILTSFPHYVSRLRDFGIKAEYFKIAFEPRVLKRMGQLERIYDVTFIGSFSPHHHAGTRLLEVVAAKTPLHIWGQGINHTAPGSPLRRHYHGEAWGLEMYRILAQSKIVINRHISVAEDNANNMRLYESTGMGALLITDAKKNLPDLFKVDKEMVQYHTPTELIDRIAYYLAHPAERESIAQAGQRRTLHDHTYQARMAELTSVLERYLQ